MQEQDVRIVVLADDGKAASRHFGRARTDAAVTVEDGAIVCRELRDKPAPHWQAERSHDDDGTREVQGTSPAAQEKHLAMLSAIRDCVAMIAAGGWAAAHTTRPALPASAPS
jgi:hypothetical protein